MAKVNYEKAWKTLKEKRIQEYIKLHQTCNQAVIPNNQYHLISIANAMKSKKDLEHILNEMDKLDGTKDFINLLADMNREDK
ncbi:hypothetical protein [Mammaliicoccus sp. G-M31]|uniref:hypothetical protein n=1 Tax=Mammaliicoccus sp. G-M31 TaxID=2898690 RepID=UPI001EFC16BA|nr:hypothetical protein [Mammaliicoccus sp. G-M31]